MDRGGSELTTKARFAPNDIDPGGSDLFSLDGSYTIEPQVAADDPFQGDKVTVLDLIGCRPAPPQYSDILPR